MPMKACTGAYPRPQAPNLSVEQVYALKCHANTWQTVFVLTVCFPWLCMVNELPHLFHAHTRSCAFTGIQTEAQSTVAYMY